MSTSRLEKFIYAICSMEVSDLPAPLSRIEILWNCLITGETPDFEPQSRNEQYLMAMLGLYELENLPTPMSRGEKLLYKIATGETDLSDIPAYLSRYEELLGYLAENGGVGDFEYILQTLNQRLSTLYSTKERPMKQSVIKGDTLVNELPRPSLKNTMVNAASQKLNQGYNVDSRTLTNLKTGHNLTNVDNVKTTYENDIYIYQAKDSFSGNIFPSNMVIFNTENSLELDTTYTMIFKYLDNYDTIFAVSGLSSSNTHMELARETSSSNNEIRKITFTISNSTYNRPALRIHTLSPNNVRSIRFRDVMILKGDYTNQDIPYFEGTKTFSATPNVVDGEFKQAVVKGQTLVNLCKTPTKTLPIGRSTSTTARYELQYLDTTKNYIVYFEVSEAEDGSNTSSLIHVTIGNWSNGKTISNVNGKFFVKIESSLIGNDMPNTLMFYFITNQYDSGARANIKNISVVEYQEGMENWDIPYFEGMQSVQLSEVTTTGVNLYKDEGGKINWTIDSTDNGAEKEGNRFIPNYYTPVEPKSIFSIYRRVAQNNFGVRFYDKNKSYISVGVPPYNGTNILSFTTPSDCYYVRFIDEYNRADNNYMIYEGNYELAYEPYQSNTLTLAEPVTLRKVGDVEDEFDMLTGQVTERVGEIVLDGSESWFIDLQSETYIRYKMLLPHKTKNHSFTISDKLQTITDDNAITDSVRTSNNSLTLWIYKINSTGLDEFKTWLSQNPITVQYQLKTESTKTVNPTIIDQDGATQTKLHSFNDGYLSVTSQGLLPSAVNYEVPTNNSYYLPDMLTLGAQYTSRGSADCNATIDGKLLALGKNRTFTTPSSVTDKLMVLDAPVDDLMFIKGDQTAKDFEYFEGMKSVEMNSIQVTGKNLWDGKWYKGFSNNGGGGELATLDDLETAYRTDYIKIPKNSDRVYVHRFCEATNYTGTNVHFGFFDKNKQLLTVEEGLSPASWSVPTNAEYVVVHVWNSVPYDFTTLRVNISTAPVNATTYEPYKSTTLTLNEPVTLRKVGDVQDTLDGLTGEVTERVGEVIFDGSDDEYWFSPYVGSNTFCIHTPFENAVRYNRLVCDKFNTSDSDLYGSPKEGVYVNKNRNLQVNILKSRLETLDENGFKIFLSKNPITIQYILAQESIKTVDLTTIDQDGQPTKLKTFNDITHAEINADNIIPSVDVEVATKISETLATIEPQQLDISNTQNELGQTIDEQAENTDATMMATTEIYEQTL